MTKGLLEGQNRYSILFSRFLIFFLKETQELPSQFSPIPPPGLDHGHVLKSFSKPKVLSDANILKEKHTVLWGPSKNEEICLPAVYLILLMEMCLLVAYHSNGFP